jgi:hypothetical protein
VAVAVAACAFATTAAAHPPLDDFLNPQDPGARFTLMPFIGPGFRAVYDHRFAIERDMSELRLQLMGTVTVPFTEVSANVDARFFLVTFGASVGYHDEWHLLRFTPDPETGRDRAGQPPSPEPPAKNVAPGRSPLPPYADPAPTFTDLDREARALKDQNGDVQSAAWPYYEGRFGFYVPGYDFLGVSTLAARWDGRPDVSFDWENGTVQSRGTSFRWESYFFLRARNRGFIGPAVRALVVPRNRVQGSPVVGKYRVVVPEGSACQMDESAPCHTTRETELHYGVIAGLRPGWGNGNDTLLARVYTTWGLGNELFGTQTFRQPLQLLVAYMVNLDL